MKRYYYSTFLGISSVYAFSALFLNGQIVQKALSKKSEFVQVCTDHDSINNQLLAHKKILVHNAFRRHVKYLYVLFIQKNKSYVEYMNCIAFRNTILKA